MEILRINDTDQHGLILGELKGTINESIDSPSFNQLIHQGAKKERIEALLAVLILKYSNMLSVGGNLKQGQSLEIAKMVLTDNPTMSLDDFNILLSNGVKGRYNEPGKLFRFDISVIYDWIEAYLEHFWEVKENLPKQPTALEMLPDEKIAEIQDVIVKAEIKSIRPITEEDVKREGREKPVKRNYVFDKELVVMQELKKQYALECTNLFTGLINEGQPTFEEWLQR